jgi:hypothetical protein
MIRLKSNYNKKANKNYTLHRIPKVIKIDWTLNLFLKII